MSVSFRNQEFTFAQPDGSSFQVRGTGNQHQAYFETLEGLPVVRDPTSGFYHIGDLGMAGTTLKSTAVRAGTVAATQLNLPRGIRPKATVVRESIFTTGLPQAPSRWETRRMQKRAMKSVDPKLGMLAPPERPTVGVFLGLCLLIEFPDVKGTITPKQVEDFCNKKGYSGGGNNGSVRDYFFDNSDGKLLYTNIVAPYYTAKHPRAYYTNPRVPQPQRARELIAEALEFHLRNGVLPFDTLTADQEYYIYATNVYYAGEVQNNWAQGLWPHSYHMESPVEVAPGKHVYDYQFTNMGAELTLGTFCHENGHMICDFPDLYDYGYESKGVGDFCMMCGSGNANPRNPPQIGAYLKHAAGWASSVQGITQNSKVTLRAGRNEFAMLRRTRTEYFIIENRSKAGRDQALPGEGLAIWHVDELGSNSDEAMTPVKHYECSLIQADGRFELERNINDGDATDLFTAGGSFTGKWWNGKPAGLVVSNVTRPGASVSFDVGKPDRSAANRRKRTKRAKTSAKAAKKSGAKRAAKSPRRSG